MRISPIINNSFVPIKNIYVNNQSSEQSIKISKNDPSFGECGNQIKKKIFKHLKDMSESELYNMAEYFNNFTKHELKSDFLTLDHFYNIGKNSGAAANILYPFIEKIQNKKSQLLSTISNLTGKALAGDSNLAEQKIILKQEFINLFKLNPDVLKDNTIANGIMIYGKEPDKDSFITWINNETNAIFKNITFNPDSASESIKKISEMAKESELAYQRTKLRSIIYVKDLDKLLTNRNNFMGIQNIGKFKGFVERASRDYHTTILMKTDKPISDFEQASIGDQRFKKINLNGGITEDEKASLNYAKNEISRLKQKAAKVYETYYDRVVDYDTDSLLFDSAGI